MRGWILFAMLVAMTTVRGSEPGEVRSLILMIGDGMGLAQVSMLQLEQGDTLTSFDRAQGVALIRTRSANSRVTDSAAAATASRRPRRPATACWVSICRVIPCGR